MIIKEFSLKEKGNFDKNRKVQKTDLKQQTPKVNWTFTILSNKSKFEIEEPSLSYQDISNLDQIKFQIETEIKTKINISQVTQHSNNK
jgi:hypothetical protein